MWQILKTEIEYNKYVLIAVYAAALLFLVVGLVRGDGFYGVVPNSIVPFFIGYGFLCHKYCKESRDRQHCILPQSRADYGLTRMLFFAFYQSGIFVMWLINYVVYIGRSPEAIWMILTVNALMLTFRAVGFIFEDTRGSVPCITSSEGWAPDVVGKRVLRFVTYTVLTILVIIAAAATREVPGFTMMDMEVDWQPVIDLREFLRAPMGAVLANVMFMVTFYLSLAFSLPRRSFASSR
ncbi:MAG: hypothetical protein OEN01_08700 [Candidatus Krumholzibacteria bacterium]|nr:hypothetical protein [Candidatus Krumholzibacteria bacterium]